MCTNHAGREELTVRVDGGGEGGGEVVECYVGEDGGEGWGVVCPG